MDWNRFTAVRFRNTMKENDEINQAGDPSELEDALRQLLSGSKKDVAKAMAAEKMREKERAVKE